VTVIVDCPQCHRSLCRFHWVVDRAEFLGTVYAENGDPGGT
jgi:hypothetical protein